MREAEHHAAAAGMAPGRLMEAAGSAVADEICRRYALRPAVVICGTGNNGGDGFVAARVLKERGWPVTVAMATETARLRGDALAAHTRWHEAEGITSFFSAASLNGIGLIIDAVFGVGLNRAPEGIGAEAIEAMNAHAAPIIAVDVPSGLMAESGELPGVAVRAACTVTFCRAKPGLFLLPGKTCAGELVVADIGIPASALPPPEQCIMLNQPALWHHSLPRPAMDTHKYRRGHAVVAGGAAVSTGAARLSALAALRSGAGLVSVACPPAALPIYAASLLAVMTKSVRGTEDFARLLNDPRIKSVLVGPGNGINARTRALTLAALETHKACVLDADALTAFAPYPQTFFSSLHASCVLTPHEGEFQRLFGGEIGGDKCWRARGAAALSGAVIVLKGNDTVIAAPHGAAAINYNAPPVLATAGSGDVLAGMIAGLLSQGMPAYEASCAAVWLHGEAGQHLTLGMTAEDLLATLPAAFGALAPLTPS